LQKTRFPVVSYYYDQFNESIRRLELPNSIKLIPPENFEDVFYSMTLRFDSFSQFESLIKTVSKISGYPEFKSIFRKDLANP
jgi:hypothetical protein